MNLFGFEIKRAKKAPARIKSAAYPSANYTRLTEDFPILTLARTAPPANLRNRRATRAGERGNQRY
jgi:hypothetical protein